MDRTKVIKYRDDVYMFDEDKHMHMLNDKPLMGVTTLIDKTLSKPALIPWAVKTTVEWIKNNCTPLLNPADSFIVTSTDLDNAKKEHNKRKTDAGDWGTRVHTACEVWAKTGEMPNADEDIYDSVNNFKEFIETNGFKVLDTERNVWSKKWWIGGIFDLVLERQGKVYIADIKTSSGIYDSHFIQMGAYYHCLRENDWVKDYLPKEQWDAYLHDLNLYASFSNDPTAKPPKEPGFTGAIVINLKKDGKMAWCSSEALDTMVDCYAGIVEIYKNRGVLDTITDSVRYGSAFY